MHHSLEKLSFKMLNEIYPQLIEGMREFQLRDLIFPLKRHIFVNHGNHYDAYVTFFDNKRIFTRVRIPNWNFANNAIPEIDITTKELYLNNITKKDKCLVLLLFQEYDFLEFYPKFCQEIIDKIQYFNSILNHSNNLIKLIDKMPIVYKREMLIEKIKK